MRKVIESHKYLLTVLICILASVFFLKTGFELISEKGIQKSEYSGRKLR